MQISRHWRMNPVRYRLQGVRYTTKEGTFYSLQGKPFSEDQVNVEIHEVRMGRVREIRRKIEKFNNEKSDRMKKLRSAA